MLSYKHAFHAGNLADVHKHGMLAVVLAYLTRKDKPISYIETHAGRGLYDLKSDEAIKTGEAAAGVRATHAWFDAAHPYADVLSRTAAEHGSNTYPGSPLIAEHLLRPTDKLHLAELHPTEAKALRATVQKAKVYEQDGFDLAHTLLPPLPRRGVLLVDPSYEVKSDYDVLPAHMRKWVRAWNVGIIMLWYPILTSGRHKAMLGQLTADHPDAMRHEVHFPPARPGHGMVGSGLFVINPPYGLKDEAVRLSGLFGDNGTAQSGTSDR